MPSGRAPVNRNPQIDTAEAARFLSVIAPDSQLTCQTFDDSEKNDRFLAQAFHVSNGTGDLTLKRLTGKRGWLARSGGILGELTELNKRGAGCFAMANQGDGEGRREENVVRVRAVFVDLDGAPLEPILECGVEPHIIVESSPGRFHAYWVVDNCPLEMFRPVQQALAERFNSDPGVHDLPRVMRIPGFLHQKHEPFRTRIHTIREDAELYHIQDLINPMNLDIDKFGEREPVSSGTGQGINGDEIFTEGQRNGAMTKCAARLRNAGLQGDRLFNALLAENLAHCKPQLPDREIREIAKWASKKQGSTDRGSSRPQPTRRLMEIKLIPVSDLIKMELVEPPWAIRGMLPSGLAILVAPPKTGKSYMAQNVSIDVAMGREAFEWFPTQSGRTLLAATEDSFHRLQKRYELLLRGATPPDNCILTDRWPRLLAPSGRDVCALGDDCVSHIERWCDANSDARLIILDTFGRIRSQPGRTMDAYSRDVMDLDPLQRVAVERQVTIMLIHHTNKGAHRDHYNTISGSTGITATADTIWVLKREDRGECNAVLTVSGRDVEEQRLALKFDRDTGKWLYIGDAAELRRTDEQQAVIDVLRSEGKPMRPADVASAIGVSVETVKKRMQRMANVQEIQRSEKRGYYVLPEPVTLPVQRECFDELDLRNFA